MFVSYKEYKKRSTMTILICTLLAIFVGSVQTGVIIWRVQKAAKK